MEEQQGVETLESSGTLTPAPPVPPDERNWVNPYVALVDARKSTILQFKDCRGDQERLGAFACSFSQVAMELGSGSGSHLVSLAEKHPEIGFIGCELRYKRAFKTAERASKLGLKNVLVLRCYAEQAHRLIAPGSLSAIFVNFPDPWPKRRDRQHRLLSSNFFRNASYLMDQGGLLSFKSDHLEYYLSALEAASSATDLFLSRACRDLHSCSFASQCPLPRSEFESMFIGRGKAVCFAQWRKLGPEQRLISRSKWFPTY